MSKGVDIVLTIVQAERRAFVRRDYSPRCSENLSVDSGMLGVLSFRCFFFFFGALFSSSRERNPVLGIADLLVFEKKNPPYCS